MNAIVHVEPAPSFGGAEANHPQGAVLVPNYFRGRLQQFAAFRAASHGLSVKHIAARLEMARVAQQLASRLLGVQVTEEDALRVVGFSRDFSLCWRVEGKNAEAQRTQREETLKEGAL